jgi:hypothetical protein
MENEIATAPPDAVAGWCDCIGRPGLETLLLQPFEGVVGNLSPAVVDGQ